MIKLEHICRIGDAICNFWHIDGNRRNEHCSIAEFCSTDNGDCPFESHEWCIYSPGDGCAKDVQVTIEGNVDDKATHKALYVDRILDDLSLEEQYVVLLSLMEKEDGTKGCEEFERGKGRL